MPREFRALIGLEAADFQQPWYDTGWLHRPDVHGGEVCAAIVSGLIAPQSPPQAPGNAVAVHAGRPRRVQRRPYFYRVDGDIREKVEAIDTSAARCIC